MLYIILIICLVAVVIYCIHKAKKQDKYHEDTFKDMIDGLPDETLDSIKDSLSKLDNNPKRDRAIELIDEEKSKRS